MSLVTGATGFIGSHLVKHLTDIGEKVVSVLHDYKPGTDKWLKEALGASIRVRGDVRDFHFMKRVLNQYDVSEVYHLAAQAIVKNASKDPINTFDINVMGTVKLLEACRQLEVKRILVQSTDKAYGEGLDKTVGSPLAPVEPYGLSKACEDLIAQNFMKMYEMNIVIARACNAYGYDRNIRIIPNIIHNCLRGEKPIIWKWEDTKRQYIYVEDLAEALTYLMKKGEKGIFNIATPDVLTPEEVVRTVLKFFPHLEPKYLEREKPTEIHQQSMRMDAFGWGPKWSFERGIEETIKKFRKYGF